nr:hypothetical protein [Novosphingobium sp. BW1]
MIIPQGHDRATFDPHIRAPHVNAFQAKVDDWIESGFCHPLARIS